MSIIAASKVPFKMSLSSIVKSLAKVIQGQFEALNFTGKGLEKTVYIRLSERLDPLQVIERINAHTKFNAFIPDSVPDLPPSSKKGKIPLKMQKRLKIVPQYSPDKVLVFTHLELMTELQSKYMGLYNLSKKTQHKLLDAIAESIFERLKNIIETTPETMGSGYLLSQAYRKLHPHFGDFQFILATLHRLQDAAAAARAQLNEQQLIGNSAQPYMIDNLPYTKVQAACHKYSEKIIKKIEEHLAELKHEPSETDCGEEVARKKVRRELKNLSPYLPLIVRQIISEHFVPQKAPFHRIRMYGEPFLPAKPQLQQLLKGFRTVKVTRSDRVFNLLKFNVPIEQYPRLAKLDGSSVGKAKIIIRSSDIPLYKVRPKLIAEMKAVFGVEHDSGEEVLPADDEDY